MASQGLSLCNRLQNVCIAVALWNERDPILKERLFGLGRDEGNHGEDVKEYYFYLDNTPTHSYMKMLYKYPQRAFPYDDLVKINKQRNRRKPEYELIDTGIFLDDRYFDVFIEYAKCDQEDILCRIEAINRGPETAPIHVLPHLWCRNTWSWGHNPDRPDLHRIDERTVRIKHRHQIEGWWYVSRSNEEAPDLLFTENETNTERLYGEPNGSPYVKDSINDCVVEGHTHRVNPEHNGTKVAAHFQSAVAPGESFTVYTRLSRVEYDEPFRDVEEVFARRISEANQFYATIQNPKLTEDEKLVQRQALAGLMWTKQFYHYSVELWLQGDPAGPPPAESRTQGRNSDWMHLYNLDVLSMPDKWEYPWYAAWDLAFHCVPIAMIDPEWAKRQLILLLREWYMHPKGQIPAYEWNFSHVNPPVHAWAAWRVYEITRDATGEAATLFLERIFHKLLMNFTWWDNVKDRHGKFIFDGGFIGLDNIGAFDRNLPPPGGGHLAAADATGWMAMYSLNMLTIALELARTNHSYEDIATTFFEHFVSIANAMNNIGGQGVSLWDEDDGFFYDSRHRSEGGVSDPLKIRSIVGLIPLFAVQTLEPDLLEILPRFKKRMDWFVKNRPQWVNRIASLVEPGEGKRRLLSIVDRKKLQKILDYMLAESEFLSEYGLRSLSRFHEDNPFKLDESEETVEYEPAESTTPMLGGNSNWRGPIWFPLNFLMIESLQKHHKYYGDSFTAELPHGSNNWVTLDKVASEISRRLASIFLKNEAERGRRAVFGDVENFQDDPHWHDHIPFYEYFHSDTGEGLGASHQTGWTALIANLLQQSSGHKD